MNEAMPYLIAVGAILVVFVLPAWFAFRKEEREAMAELAAAKAAGRHEPVSIRPWVDEAKCMGSGACLAACPEHAVLAIVGGQARLANATACIGHGACATACPRSAIELVFGSEKRGVDLPKVGPDFQTDVPGLFVAGELGGMGLIANAIEQGTQATRQALSGRKATSEGLDLIIVGAGPAGVAAGLEAKKAHANVVILEQDVFGGAIRHYPRGKIVMAHGYRLPGQKRRKSGTISKETLIEELGAAIDDAGLDVSEGEPVTSVQRLEDGRFEVITGERTLHSSAVLLCVGRRGTPRKLGVTGEDREKVSYRLLEPEQYRHKHVLVVGGGDSAVEAAITLGAEEGCRVTLSYRKEHIVRAKQKNQEKLAASVAAGHVKMRTLTEVADIGADRVVLVGAGAEANSATGEVLPNDAVLIFCGGVLPTKFLADAGIALQRHHAKLVTTLEETAPVGR
ncbi:MAG: NAD(P)-binding domain-containing protein [Deltaproteobacteria bacterium]|nr:NAD(P)-binding domain-containing protein [Deltaproteobacteria bacterium]